MKAEHHGRCASVALAACRGVFALALATVWQVSHAAGFPSFMQTVTGKSTTVKAASNGTPIVTSAVGLTPGGGWQSAGNFGVAQGAGGAVNVGGVGAIAVNGKNVPVQVTGSVSKADVVGAVVSCATGGVVGCALGAMPLAAALLSSSAIRVSPTVPGQLEMQDTEVCTMAPCTGYGAPQVGGYVHSSYGKACEAYVSVVIPLIPGAVFVRTLLQGSSGSVCVVVYLAEAGNEETATLSMGEGSIEPKSPTWYPTTTQAARDELYKKNVSPLLVPELAKNGVGVDKMPVGQIGVTGPATITSSTTTTVNNIDNSVRTSTTTNNYTYNNSTATNTGSQTRTTTTTSTGETTEDTTATMNPGEEAPVEETPKETQCDKYPDTLGCAELDTVEGTIPKSTKEVSYTAESVWGGGSCPADKTWASQTLGQSYTLVPWAKACEWAVGMRAIVLLLAAWAAFWVVMPGNTQVKPQ